jgi:hypothetical protein
MKDNNDRASLLTLSQGTSVPTRVPPAVTETISRYKTPANLLSIFNPSRQIEYTRDQRRAYLGKAPSLGLVAKSFAYGTAISWLSIQLSNLAEFSGCKQKLTLPQIEEIAQIIMSEYGYLKLTEVMDFFRRFKSGEYGKFYGAVDPMVITCALRDFATKRLEIIRNFEKEDKAQRERNSPEDIKYRQAYERMTRMKSFYSHNFRSEDFTMEEFEEIWWLFNLGYEHPDHGYSD